MPGDPWSPFSFGTQLPLVLKPFTSGWDLNPCGRIQTQSKPRYSEVTDLVSGSKEAQVLYVSSQKNSVRDSDR